MTTPWLTDEEYFERNLFQPLDAVDDYEFEANAAVVIPGPVLTLEEQRAYFGAWRGVGEQPPDASRGSKPRYLGRALTAAERQRIRRARKRGEVPTADPPLTRATILARLRAMRPPLGARTMARIEAVLR